MLLTLVGRRTATALLMASSVLRPSSTPAAELIFKDAGPEGFQYADVKVGSGSAPAPGQRVAIDYVMSTTGARYGAKIDSTVDRQAPYSWTLGDGTTIRGLELAVAGGEGVPPMLPGGVRRGAPLPASSGPLLRAMPHVRLRRAAVIIPSNPTSNLAYSDLARPNKNNLQVQDCSTGRGPIPPNAPTSSSDMGAGEFQRFKNIYCNANRPYQPDLVLDVKLFGKRS